MVNGNTSGLKEHILNSLDELYNSKIEKGKIISMSVFGVFILFTLGGGFLEFKRRNKNQ